MLQTLHINSKLRQQQTHYSGKKERESFFKKPPKLSFLLKETLQSCMWGASPVTLRVTSSPPALCSTPRPMGDGGRQHLGCRTAKRKPRIVTGISSGWEGSTHKRHNSTQTHQPQRPMCFWRRQTEGAGPSITAKENTMATKAVGKALLLASPATVMMLRNTTQHHSPSSVLLLSLCNPLPLGDKGVQSFPSCCIPLRCT